MPSVIQKRSYNSVKIFWLNKELLETNIFNAVNTLADSRLEVKKVILFGSIAENRGLPSSDVDILIIVSESTCRFIDRALDFQKFFEDVGLGVDLFVYTEEEIERYNIPLANSAMKKGKFFVKEKEEKSHF